MTTAVVTLVIGLSGGLASLSSGVAPMWLVRFWKVKVTAKCYEIYAERRARGLYVLNRRSEGYTYLGGYLFGSWPLRPARDGALASELFLDRLAHDVLVEGQIGYQAFEACLLITQLPQLSQETAWPKYVYPRISDVVAEA